MAPQFIKLLDSNRVDTFSKMMYSPGIVTCKTTFQYYPRGNNEITFTTESEWPSVWDSSLTHYCTIHLSPSTRYDKSGYSFKADNIIVGTELFHISNLLVLTCQIRQAIVLEPMVIMLMKDPGDISDVFIEMCLQRDPKTFNVFTRHFGMTFSDEFISKFIPYFGQYNLRIQDPDIKLKNLKEAIKTDAYQIFEWDISLLPFDIILQAVETTPFIISKFENEMKDRLSLDFLKQIMKTCPIVYFFLIKEYTHSINYQQALNDYLKRVSHVLYMEFVDGNSGKSKCK